MLLLEEMVDYCFARLSVETGISVKPEEKNKGQAEQEK